MKNVLAILFFAFAFAAQAQVTTPAASPAASVTTVVGLTDIRIDYSRPSVKGRKIFGDKDVICPNGTIWRTGANAGTKITFSDDVTVEGIAVPKGEYLIFSWPGASEWTISLYKDISLGGNTGDYNKEKEAANFKVKSEQLSSKVETLTINIGDIAADSKSAKVQIAWENTSVKFTVGVDFESRVLKSIEASTKLNPNNLYAAAQYYLETGKDLKPALEWITTAAAARPEAFWMMHVKAKIQKALGDKKGAMESAMASKATAEKAKNADYVRMNDDLMKGLK
ncbi:MAG TPA: DUF2911 domain-containing protein [Cyclobacteriaceae bacterium]|nr:DUF2911 domain-containing protein [Cyclobacteriaceae bacterium]